MFSYLYEILMEQFRKSFYNTTPAFDLFTTQDLAQQEYIINSLLRNKLKILTRAVNQEETHCPVC